MKKCISYLISIVLFSLIAISCTKILGLEEDCGDSLTVENANGLELHIKDTTVNKYIYQLVSPLYNIDSLQIWNSQGEKYKLFVNISVDTSTHYGAYNDVSIYGIYNSNFDTNIYEDTIRKDIYIKYNKNEYDTLNICFKANHAKCGGVFAFIKVMRKGKLISYTQNDFAPRILIKK